MTKRLYPDYRILKFLAGKFSYLHELIIQCYNDFMIKLCAQYRTV